MSKFSYDPNYKLRIVVDKELPAGAQLAQAMHAAIEFLFEHPEISQDWHTISNSLVIMATTYDKLLELIDKCIQKDINYSLFREPDMDYKLTAICLEPTEIARKVTSNFPLTLKGYSLAA